MKNFGWSQIKLADNQVFMGPAREDTLGGKPFIYIEAVGTDGLLHPSWFKFDQVLWIRPVDEKYARESFAIMGHSIADIKKVVAEKFNVSVPALESADRHDFIVKPRWVAFVIARELGFKLQYISTSFNRDHGTVSYGVEEAYHRASVDRNFKFHLDICRRIFGIEEASTTNVQPALNNSKN